MDFSACRFWKDNAGRQQPCRPETEIHYLRGVQRLGEHLEHAGQLDRTVDLYRNRMLAIMFRTSQDILRDLVPEPLVVNPDCQMIIYIGALNIVSPLRVSYLEAGIMIPASDGREEPDEKNPFRHKFNGV